MDVRDYWSWKAVGWAFFGGLGMVVGMLGFPVWCEWRALHTGDTLVFSSYDGITLRLLPAGLWLMATPIVALIGIGCLVIEKYRKFGIPLVLCAAIYGGGYVVCTRMAVTMRHDAFVSLAERSMPLVHAIERYVGDTGSPPTTLEALVPEYINEVPNTGLRGYPAYQYEVGPDHERWYGNPWVLYVETPNGRFTFDKFLYLPLQNYPAGRAYSGWLEPIGRWAYVHD